MNRTAVFTSLVALLLIVGAVMFVFRPQNEEIADLHAEREQLEAQERDLAARVEELRQVRAAAPEHEATLAAASAVVPHETAMPAMLRQLQASADEAGLDLVAIAPSRPAPVTLEGADHGLSTINLTVDVEGGYFQMVDFLRRLEDPTISPRGVNWRAVSVSSDPEDYPLLTASLQGDTFAILPTGAGGATDGLFDDAEPGDDEASDDAPADGDDLGEDVDDTEAELADGAEVQE